VKELLATEAVHQARGAALLIKNDARGMSSLAARRGGLHLARAAAALGALHRAVPLNVCTGFPVGGAPETDGPAGALVAIGDGGNEFGMGVVEPAWFDAWNVRPPVSRCAHLIPAQVSNWGALGLVAALSRLTGQDLLPSAHGYNRLLEDLAAAGFVDGLSGEAAPTEDGHPPGAGGQVVDELRRWVALDAGTAD
jgi:hypothetical protein